MIQWELGLAKRLAKPGRFDPWCVRHGVTSRRVLWVCLGVGVPLVSVATYFQQSAQYAGKFAGAPTWVFVREWLTRAGGLLIPLAFLLLLRMRRCTWTWTATGFLAAWTIPYVVLDALAVHCQASLQAVARVRACKVATMLLLVGGLVLLFFWLLGTCDRIAGFADVQRAARCRATAQGTDAPDTRRDNAG
jgi:hypothetical protein